MQRLRTVGAAITTLALAGALAACGGEETPGSSETKVIEITIDGGTIEPSGDRVDVAAGQPVDLVVTADTSGSLHMHSDPEQEFTYEPGEQTFEIQIDRPGVIEVESHDPEQIIVQLEVR